jgi:hypothetical protein
MFHRIMFSCSTVHFSLLVSFVIFTVILFLLSCRLCCLCYQRTVLSSSAFLPVRLLCYFYCSVFFVVLQSLLFMLPENSVKQFCISLWWPNTLSFGTMLVLVSLFHRITYGNSIFLLLVRSISCFLSVDVSDNNLRFLLLVSIIYCVSLCFYIHIEMYLSI